jgi:hypothetical protein
MFVVMALAVLTLLTLIPLIIACPGKPTSNVN